MCRFREVHLVKVRVHMGIHTQDSAIIYKLPTTNVVLILALRLRRWPNIKTALVQYGVFTSFLGGPA